MIVNVPLILDYCGWMAIPGVFTNIAAHSSWMKGVAGISTPTISTTEKTQTIQKPDIFWRETSNLHKVWDESGSGAADEISIWRADLSEEVCIPIT